MENHELHKTFAREKLFQLIFSELFDAKNENWENTFKAICEDSDVNVQRKTMTDSDKYYIESTFKKILEKKDQLVGVLNNSISGYSFEKLYANEKAILLIAVYELTNTDIPSKVVINEAVELAKKFGGLKSYSFVNGVLSGVVKKINE